MIRGYFTCCDVATFSMAELDQVVANHEGFLDELLRHTRRPNPKLLESGMRAAFTCPGPAAALFGKQLAAAVSYCRKKGESMHDGAKLPPAVRHICQTHFPSEKTRSKAQLSSFAVKEGRKLRKRISDESNQV